MHSFAHIVKRFSVLALDLAQNVEEKVNYDDYDYCPNCGQHIDWSEEE